MQSTTLSVLVDGIVGLAIIAAGVVLLSLGHIDGQTAIALIGAGAALASGSTKSALALRVPAPSQLVTQPTYVYTATAANTTAATEPPPPPLPPIPLTPPAAG